MQSQRVSQRRLWPAIAPSTAALAYNLHSRYACNSSRSVCIVAPWCGTFFVTCYFLAPWFFTQRWHRGTLVWHLGVVQLDQGPLASFSLAPIWQSPWSCCFLRLEPIQFSVTKRAES